MCESGCKSIVVEHIHGATENPCKLKLMKMSKGFQWEISMSGEDFVTIAKKIDEINEVMKAKYGGAQ